MVKALVVRCQGLAAVVLLLGGPAVAATISVKRGDRKPAVTWVALDAGGKRVDLTGATAKFRMREPVTGCTILGAATIPSTKTGNLRYDWKLGDTDFAGSYDAEFLVTFPDLTTWTFPTVGTISITIEPNAADPTPNNPSVYCQGSQPIPVQHGATGDPATGLIPQGLHVFRYRGIGYQDMKTMYTGIIGPGAWAISTSGQPSALHPLEDNDRDVGMPTKRPRYVYAATGLLVGGRAGTTYDETTPRFRSGSGVPSSDPAIEPRVYIRTDTTPSQYTSDGATWSAAAWIDGTTTNSPVQTGAGIPISTPADGTIYVRTAGDPPHLYLRVAGQWIAQLQLRSDVTLPLVVGASAPMAMTSGPGAMSGACTVPGAMHLRTDGGAGSTLYVCEGATWAAK